MYGNYYGGYPQPMGQYQNPYQARLDAMQAAQTPPRYEITRVNGKNGADAFVLPPNSSVLLLDETAPLVWLAQTDGAGYKTVTPYKIAPYQAEPTPDINTLESRVARLEALINGKSDIAGNEQNAAAGNTGG